MPYKGAALPTELRSEGRRCDELFLELDAESAEFTPIESPQKIKPAAERVRVLDTVAGSPDTTADQIAEELSLPKAMVRRHLTALYEAGELRRDGAGKRGDPFRWRTHDENDNEAAA
jgi:DNA-binding transcriptional ArsR family regulator